MKARIVPEIERALEATGLPWDAEAGTRHIKLRLAGFMVGIHPVGGNHKKDTYRRAVKNVVAQIRRAAETIKAGGQPTR